MRKILFLLIGLICANAPAAEQLVERVSIVVKSGADEIRSEGRLYTMLGNQAERQFVANVNADGTVDAPFHCKSPVRIWAEPNRDDVATLEEGAKPCDSSMEFRFEVLRVADSGSFARGVILVNGGKPGAAQIAFSQAAEEAHKNGNARVAVAAGNAAVSAAAAALGDTNREKFVTRDPSQDYRMVLTKDGKEKLQEFQRASKIEVTGQLDYATQKALSRQAEGIQLHREVTGGRR